MPWMNNEFLPRKDFYFLFFSVVVTGDAVCFRMFKECPHPDEKARNQLSRELSLHPRQIKFWFQNRRTQMKVRFFLILAFYDFLILISVSFM